jgi:hypothetical protein
LFRFVYPEKRRTCHIIGGAVFELSEGANHSCKVSSDKLKSTNAIGTDGSDICRKSHVNCIGPSDKVGGTNAKVLKPPTNVGRGSAKDLAVSTKVGGGNATGREVATKVGSTNAKVLKLPTNVGRDITGGFYRFPDV